MYLSLSTYGKGTLKSTLSSSLQHITWVSDSWAGIHVLLPVGLLFPAIFANLLPSSRSLQLTLVLLWLAILLSLSL